MWLVKSRSACDYLVSLSIFKRRMQIGTVGFLLIPYSWPRGFLIPGFTELTDWKTSNNFRLKFLSVQLVFLFSCWKLLVPFFYLEHRIDEHFPWAFFCTKCIRWCSETPLFATTSACLWPHNTVAIAKTTTIATAWREQSLMEIGRNSWILADGTTVGLVLELLPMSVGSCCFSQLSV